MAERVSIKSYQGPDGRVDWVAFSAAQRANGEECTRCRQSMFYIINDPPGRPRLCGACEALDQDQDEVDSDRRIRCPACRHQMDVVSDASDWAEIYQEGCNAVSCVDCGHDFEVSTHVSFTFTSPALSPGEEDADAETVPE